MHNLLNFLKVFISGPLWVFQNRPRSEKSRIRILMKMFCLGSNPADANDGGSGWIAEGYSPWQVRVPILNTKPFKYRKFSCSAMLFTLLFTVGTILIVVPDPHTSQFVSGPGSCNLPHRVSGSESGGLYHHTGRDYFTCLLSLSSIAKTDPDPEKPNQCWSLRIAGPDLKHWFYFFRLWNRMHYSETVACRGSFEKPNLRGSPVFKRKFFRNKIESQELRQKIVDNYHQSKVIILPNEMLSILADQ